MVTLAELFSLAVIAYDSIFRRAEHTVQREARWFRHYLAGIAYCSGKKRGVYAITFDVERNDKSGELFNALIDGTSMSCGNQSDTGYSVEATSEGRNSFNTYPSIEVGAL